MTTSNNCHAETGSCMLISVPLNAACQIVTAAPVHVTAGVSTYKSAVNRETPTDYSAKNFGGAECGPIQKADTVEKWLDITGEACMVDWAFMSSTDGNPTVVDGSGNVVGYAKLQHRSQGACSAITKPKSAVVVVRRAASNDGGCSMPAGSTGATGVVGHFFPATADWCWDIPDHQDARAMIPFTATSYANPQIGAGPLNLWPAAYTPDAIPGEAMWAPVFLNPGALPDVSCDLTISHPVPASRFSSV